MNNSNESREVIKMNTAEMLVKCLESEGVEYIFGIPGEENLDLMNALNKSGKIKFITTRHEQGAAFMADVYGRLTGKPGVCLSTLGPGATNLMTGVADANLDAAPLVAITGQVGTDKMHIVSHQYLDLVAMFKPVTKWNKQIVRPDTVMEIVRSAFKEAVSGKPGAVHIDLPNNIAAMEVEGKPLKKPLKQKYYTSYENVEKAAVTISRAKNPLILVGNGCIRAKASEAVNEFSKALKLPVTNTFMGKGVIPFDDKYSMWTVGIPQKDYINKIFEKTDLVITIGYDLVEYSPFKWNKENKIKIIHIGEDIAPVNMYYQPDVEVVGDISDSLYEIQKRSTRSVEPDFDLKIKAEMVKEYESYAEDRSFPMKPQKILYDIRKVMGEEDIVLSDVGANKMWVARHYHCYKPNTCLISNGFASMGFAVPGAISAKLVNPDKKVLAITGDAGFMMNNQELETARRIGTPFVTIIFNDNSYGLIKWKQNEKFGNSCYVDFTNPDFKMFAESMGLKGYTIEKAEDLVATLEDAFKQKVPAVIDCKVDYGENMKLTNRLKKLFEKEI